MSADKSRALLAEPVTVSLHDVRAVVATIATHRAHLANALDRVDELTAEVERLRLAGVTATRGTECHITRGRDV